MAPDAAVLIWEWARTARRWSELALACLDSRA